MRILTGLALDRLKLSRFAALSLLLALVAVPAEADTGGWSVAGALPSGGVTSRIVIDPVTPSTLYAAAQQGQYKSTDSGASWKRIFKTLNPPADFAIDPQNPDILYLVSTDSEGGFYKSTDGGATWAKMDSGILGKGPFVIDQLVHVAVDPVNEGVVYVGANNTGVYKSTDGGAHWTQSSTGIVMGSTVNTQVLRLVVDPVSPAVVYAFVDTYDGSASATYLYKSADSGATWTALSSTPYFLFPEDVEIDPADHTHLIASFGNSIDASHNSGALFTVLYTSAFPQTLAFDPSDSKHILVGSNTSLYVSSDGSTFSSDSKVPSNGIAGIAFDPVTPSNIYLGSTAWGVLKSSDSGATWSQSTSGIPNLAATRLLEGADGILYMSTARSGIYKSLDQGATWAEVGAGFAGSLPTAADAVIAFAQDPTAPAKLYVGSASGLYRSSDGGDSWMASNTGMPFQASVRFLVVDPEAPSTLYAGLSWYASSGQAGVYKSENGGASWAAASSGLAFPTVPLVNAIAVDPHHSGVVYVAPYQNGLFKSVDGGASWAESDTGMGKVDIFAVAVDPTDSTKVYVAAVEGVYKSADGGATWTPSSTQLPQSIYTDLLIDPLDPSILYLVQPWLGESYVSTDGASTWQPLNSGALAVASVYLGATLIDPLSHHHLYAVGNDGKFYVRGMPAPPVANNRMVDTTVDNSLSDTLSASSPYTGLALSLSYVLVSNPAHGQVDLDATTGNFIYTPVVDFVGNDSFTFDVTDPYGGVSNTATEQVTVHDVAAIANDGGVQTTPDTAVRGTLLATRAYSAQTLDFSLVSNPSHGTVSLTPVTGEFRYAPSTGFAGTDSFTFQVTDAFGTVSGIATETVTVNDIAPKARDAQIKVTARRSFRGNLKGITTYNGQILSYSVVSVPLHGTLTITDPGTGAYTYAASPGFNGGDSFTFQVTDQWGTASNIATVSIVER
jgi:photosystem II stability/assembly factor-like uncharacterized protein